MMEGVASGRLVLVVGPSGAGKDSVIRHARERLAGDARFVFPRRVVTRPPSEAEDNLEADAAAFASMADAGAFAACWEAHGLRYGIPVAIEADLNSGRTVICNVSRTVVPALRGRYPNVLAVEITASPEILVARLEARARAADGDRGERLARSAQFASAATDVTIDNSGPLGEACAAFLDLLTAGLAGEAEPAANQRARAGRAL